ncbi:MAG: hypothetical protein WC378_01055 [Opitutaceae bacterium]|jgi:hypothetical protein
MAQYIGQAVRERMQREGMLHGSETAFLKAQFDELVKTNLPKARELIREKTDSSLESAA